MSPNSAELALALPTGRLLLIPAVACLLVGAGWAGVTMLVGGALQAALGALLASASAAGAAVVSMLAIGPWRRRPLIRWPFVFLVGTLLQTLLTLLGGLLLYFAAFAEAIGTWLCLVVSFWAGLAGLVCVYGSHVKRATSAEPVSTARGKRVSRPSTE
jgi:hypothetical protein